MEAAERRKLTDMERIANNRAIAESYFHAYDKKAVKEGAVYDTWHYAPHAEYWSPYFRRKHDRPAD